MAFTDHLDLMGWQVEPSDLVGYEHFRPFVAPDGLLAPLGCVAISLKQRLLLRPTIFTPGVVRSTFGCR